MSNDKAGHAEGVWENKPTTDPVTDIEQLKADMLNAGLMPPGRPYMLPLWMWKRWCKDHPEKAAGLDPQVHNEMRTLHSRLHGRRAGYVLLSEADMSVVYWSAMEQLFLGRREEE